MHRAHLAGAARRRHEWLGSSGERAPTSSRPSGSRASASAIARPMPRFAPVISAVFPVSSTARCTGGL